MSKEQEESLTPDALMRDAVTAWRRGWLMESFLPRELGAIDQDSLWYLVHDKLSSKLAAYNIQVHTGDLKRAVMSIQSVTGGLAEKLVSETGRFILKGVNVEDRVIRDSAFQSAVTSAGANLGGKTSTQDLHAAAQKLSINFYISPAYGEDVIAGKAEKVTYPDLVVVRNYESEKIVFACEQKLSGDNDSKAVAKNLEELVSWKERLVGDFTVETAVLLPFSDESKRRRWEKPKSTEATPDWVLVNGQVWEKLFDLPSPEDWYDTTVEILAETAADLFAITLLGDTFDYDINPEDLSVSWRQKNPTSRSEAGRLAQQEDL